jgi:hypothetical protein
MGIGPATRDRFVLPPSNKGDHRGSDLSDRHYRKFQFFGRAGYGTRLAGFLRYFDKGSNLFDVGNDGMMARTHQPLVVEGAARALTNCPE